MKSLLGQFYNRIRGSQEDIVSEGLLYILSESRTARDSLSKLVTRETGLNLTDLHYESQKTGKNQERPDLVAIDENGNEKLAIESKFWASLTDNQPNTYIDRLENNSVLMFLVPSLRTNAIMIELQRRIYSKFTHGDLSVYDNHIVIDQPNIHIIIRSWDQVFSLIRDSLVQDRNDILVSDIDQLIGFTEAVESDLSQGIGKSIRAYHDLVDKVIDRYRKAPSKGFKLLNRASPRIGYRRYFVINNFGFALCLVYTYWERYAATPFWLAICEIIDTKWSTSDGLFRRCQSIAARQYNVVVKDDAIYLSLMPKLYVSENEVVNDLVEQTIELIRYVLNQPSE